MLTNTIIIINNIVPNDIKYYKRKRQIINEYTIKLLNTKMCFYHTPYIIKYYA